jgi:hypothetical protein
MASLTSNDFYRTPASSTTQNIPRSVEDKVRDLYPEAAKLMALVAVGQVKGGQMTEQAGRIQKKKVDQTRFECYAYTPLAVALTVGVASNGTAVSVTVASNIVAPYCVFNTANGTTARIDSIATLALTYTSFGATAFSAAIGDTLIVMAPAYGEASKDPIALWKDEDNIYNVTTIARIPVAISGTAKATPSYFGDYWTRMKKIGFMDGKRKIENTLLFSNRPSSGNTTSGGSAFSTAFGTTKGLWQWAATTFNCGGSFTPDKFKREIPSYYADNTTNSVSEQAPMIMFCGTEVSGIMQSWVSQVQRIDQAGGTVDVFGLKAKNFQTSNFAVNVMIHDAFNQGAMKNKAILFNPEELFYAFLGGRDIKPKNNIQSPSTDGYMDEIIGEIGLGVRDAGNSIMQLTNIYAL